MTVIRMMITDYLKLLTDTDLDYLSFLSCVALVTV